MKYLKGETLVEITISLGILTIALTGATLMIANVTHTTVDSKLKSQGTAYAEEGNEVAAANIKNCGCLTGTTPVNFYIDPATGSTLKLTGQSFSTIPPGSDYQITGATGGTFYRDIKVNQLSSSDASLVPGAPVSSFWKIDTKVTWPTSSGYKNSEIITIVAGSE